jgi:hypothetical protein
MKADIEHWFNNNGHFIAAPPVNQLQDAPDLAGDQAAAFADVSHDELVRILLSWRSQCLEQRNKVAFLGAKLNKASRPQVSATGPSTQT